MILISAGIFLFLLLSGTFFDLDFSKLVYTPRNFLSYFVEYLGTLSSAVIFSLSGVLLFLYFKNSKRYKYGYIYKYMCLALILLAGAFWGYDTFDHYLSKSIYAVGIGVLVITPFSYLFYLDLKRKYEINFARIAVIIIIAFACSTLLTFGIKTLICRPRYYYLVSQDMSYYRNWYEISFVKSGYPGVAMKTYLESFPSGHSSFSALNYLLLLFPFVKKDNRNKRIVYISVTIYCLLVMFGRILDGHHYLSDVAFGYFIGTASVFLSTIFIKHNVNDVKDSEKKRKEKILQRKLKEEQNN